MVMVKCRKCGNSAEADSFVLDPLARMVVCPNCLKSPKKVIKKEVRIKEIDETFDGIPVLNKKPKLDIIEQKSSVEKIDDRRIKYKCAKCGFKFVYDTVNKRPHDCGYCGELVDF